MSGPYNFEVPGIYGHFTADRLRWDHYELKGELTVRTELPGAQTIDGVLSRGNFNFSSPRTRKEQAAYLQARARTNGKGPDWLLILEDICLQVIAEDRKGDPMVKLRDLPKPERDDGWNIHGLVFPRRNPAIIFGDGGAAKSYTALYIGGVLAGRGLKVGLFDWELAGEDHRFRYEYLFGENMPEFFFYTRCRKSIFDEQERLIRFIQDLKLDYCIFDSIAFACRDAPESAEIASRYFGVIGELGIGTLHLAHVNRSEHAEEKPFGSTFWHNGARMTWFVKKLDDSAGVLKLGFQCKKNNLGPIPPPVGFQIRFEGGIATFEPCDWTGNISMSSPQDVEDLTVKERLDNFLRENGSKTVQELSSELSISKDTIWKTLQRNRKHFIWLAGGRVTARDVQ